MKVKLFSETVGTFFLLLIVVGSGIMGENLTSNKAVVLLANSTATILGLTVLIWTFAPYSDSHFFGIHLSPNPLTTKNLSLTMVTPVTLLTASAT